MVRLGKLIRGRRRPLVAVALAALTGLPFALSPLGMPVAHAVTAFGPAAPYGPSSAQIPTWFTDAGGLKLQPCFTGPPTCFSTAAQFSAPNGEAFYFNSTATLNTAPPKGQKALVSRLVVALEGAFVPAPGPNVFQRIRMRIQTPQTGTYTVTYPYGTKTFNVTKLAKGFEINDTVDTGCFAQPCNFSLATGSGPGMIDPFLRWATGTPPAGFISDGVTPRAVTGSPNGTNFFRVEGPGINPNAGTNVCPGFTGAASDCIQTDLFVLQGQLASSLAAAPTSLAFAGQAVGTTSAPQAVTLTNGGTTAVTFGTVTTTGASATDFAVAAGDTCSGATVAAGGTCSVPVVFTPSLGGARSAQLTVPSNDPASPFTISLTGTGIAPAPTISGFTPANGPVGTSVNVTGTNLTGASAVTFNGTAATFTVNPDGSITTTVPSAATTGPIGLTTSGGTATSASAFTVTAPPTPAPAPTPPPSSAPSISGFTPNAGNSGTAVTISGSGFTGATDVSFNGTPARSYTVVSDTRIDAVVGTGTTGGPITVTTPAGSATSASSFKIKGKAQ